VTNQRLLRLKKGRHDWAPIPLTEVAETHVNFDKVSEVYGVVVLTRTSKRYAESDSRRYSPDHFFHVDFADPQEAQALRAIIDTLVQRRNA